MTTPRDPGRAIDEWLGIHACHLTALSAVADTSSFAAAADQLGYVQSAVSRQIAFLEGIIGSRLIDRSTRPRTASLTPTGTVLLEHAEEILRQLAEAKAELDECATWPETMLYLGVSRLFGERLIGRLLASAVPTDGVRLELGAPRALLARVERHALDGAFVELPIAAGPFSAVELTTEPRYVAVTEAAGSISSASAALEQLPLVRIQACSATERLRQSLRLRGDGQPRLVEHEAPTPAAALALVRAGVGTAVVTRDDLGGDPRGVRLLPLDGLPPRVLGFAWERGRDGDTSVTQFADTVRRVLRTKPRLTAIIDPEDG